MYVEIFSEQNFSCVFCSYIIFAVFLYEKGWQGYISYQPFKIVNVLSGFV